MGMLNGVRQINRIIAGTDDAAALQTNLGTAANAGSFTQALATRSQFAAAANSPNGAAAMRGSAIAEPIMVASDHAQKVIMPIGSTARPRLITSMWKNGYGEFKPTAPFSSVTLYGFSTNGTGGYYLISVGRTWVATTSSGNQLFFSNDNGNSWTITSTTLASSVSPRRMNEANGFGFYAAENGDSANSTCIWRIIEGQTTSLPTLVLNTGVTTTISNVVSNGSVYIVTRADSTTNAWSSSDGISWTSRTCIAMGGSNTGCWIPSASLFAFLGSTTTGMTTPDGVTYTSRTVPNLGSHPQMVANSSICVASGSIGSTISTVQTTTNGTTWTSRSLPSNAQRGQLCSANGIFFFLPYSLTNIFTWSADGITWYDTAFKSMPNASNSLFGWNRTLGNILSFQYALANTVCYVV